MATMRARDHVGIGEVGADAGRDGLGPDVGVDEPGHVALAELPQHTVLEQSDAQHRLERGEQF